MLHIPFYKCKGYSCAEYNIKSVLEYYFPDRRFKINDLRSLLSKNKCFYNPYMFQLANAFSKFDLEIDYFSNYNLEKLLSMNKIEKVNEFKKYFGNAAQNVIEKTDFNSFNNSLKEIIDSKKIKKTSITFLDVEEAFFKSDVVICLLNQDIYSERENKFNGHYVVLTEIKEDYVLYHNVGPIDAEPNKKVDRKKFISCWNNMCFFDENTIFIRKTK